MAIKLLSKQEIAQRQSNQKRAEIDEGKKLAQRIDRLRELAAQEEASLASFRAKTLKSINQETEKATKERDAVLSEVQQLRDELKIGFSELKKAEKAVIERENKAEELIKQAENRLSLIQQKEIQIKTEFDQNAVLLQRLQYVNGRLFELHRLTESKFDIASATLEEIELKQYQFTKMYDHITKELRDKDIEVASRERDITIKEERIKRQQKILKERELQLRDRELTLEREIKRLKK